MKRNIPETISLFMSRKCLVLRKKDFRFSPKMTARTRAILQALLVTFIWSTTWIFVKLSLGDIPPLIFAGMRYFGAALILLLGLRKYMKAVNALSLGQWIQLILLGFVFYTLTQGLIFLTLKQIDVTALSLLLNFTPIFTALFSFFVLNEIPAKKQWIGIGLFLIGVLFFFLPMDDFSGRFMGLALGGLAVIANAAAVMVGRSVNCQKFLPAFAVTAISMGVGGAVLLVFGLAIEPFPRLTGLNIVTLAWLVLVNTAFAFTLWNRTLQILTAVEASVINNTMLVQVAVLAWVFLGEELGWIDIIGLVFASVGVLIASLNSDRKS